MTDSADRKPGQKLTEEEKLKLQSFKVIPYSERVELSDLPRWAKTAMVRLEVYGESYKEVAKHFGKAASTLSSYAKCPAGKKWREQLREFANDPIEVAKAYLRGNALNLSLDRIAHLEQAQKAGDYAIADKIAADIMDRIGIAKKTERGNTQAIIVRLDAGSLEIPLGEYKVEEADFEIADE